MINLSRIQKQSIVLINDVLISFVSTWIAFSIRHQEALLSDYYYYENTLFIFLIPVLCFIPVYILSGIYMGVFRFVGLTSLRNIFIASIGYAILLSSILFIFKIDGIPRSIGLIQPVFFTLLVFMSRIMAVQIIQTYQKSKNLKKIIIYGAGKSGIETANAISTNDEYKIICFIDDDVNKRGKNIDGIPITDSRNLSKVITERSITDLFIAIQEVTPEFRKKIISTVSKSNINIKFLPSIDTLFKGKLSLTDFENVNLDDILQRDIEINKNQIHNDISKKVILISGGGGSIGSELSRQVLLCKPKKLIVLDHSEFNLYSIMETLKKVAEIHTIETELLPVLLSIQDKNKLESIFKEYKIDIIYHAAAYKHVPLLEQNITQAVLNNIFGTYNLVELSMSYLCKKFILVSTDKAVRPTNIMGATKRIAELIVQAFASQKDNTVNFGIVRFGNVVNSSGSVIPLFVKQINSGGPVTVTDKNVTRFFMTIPQAVSLILQSSLYAKKGEVFVLNMGKPIKILDLAKKMIRLSGFEEKNEDGGQIEIQFTGLRPGEKLHEELFIAKNNHEEITKDILIANEEYLDLVEIKDIIKKYEEQIIINNIHNLKKLIEETKIINFHQKT